MNSIKFQTAYYSDDDFKKLDLPTKAEQKLFYSLLLENQRDLLKIYMSTECKKEKRVIEQIRESRKGDSLIIKIARKQSEMIEPILHESQIKEINFLL